MCRYTPEGGHDWCSGYHSGVYRATRFDAENMFEVPELIPVAIIDLPFALAIDTLLLPYDLGVVIKDSYKQSKWEQIQAKKLKSTLEAMNKTTFSCPEGHRLKVKEWLKDDSATRYCVAGNLKDGPHESWKAQHIDITGGYSRGLKHGEWIWFNKDGSIWQKALYYEGDIFSFRQLTSKGWEPVPHLKNDRPKTPEPEE